MAEWYVHLEGWASVACHLVVEAATEEEAEKMAVEIARHPKCTEWEQDWIVPYKDIEAIEIEPCLSDEISPPSQE